MKHIPRPVYIFALNSDNPDLEQHILLDAGLSQSQFKTLTGAYKGEHETSYLVDADFKDLVYKLAREYNQESIMFLDNERNASLIYLDTDKIEPIGKFQTVSNIKGLDAYTIDNNTNKAYTAL